MIVSTYLCDDTLYPNVCYLHFTLFSKFTLPRCCQLNIHVTKALQTQLFDTTSCMHVCISLEKSLSNILYWTTD